MKRDFKLVDIVLVGTAAVIVLDIVAANLAGMIALVTAVIG